MAADGDGDRKQHIGIHGWFQLSHPSPPRILYIIFALQCSKCLPHSWWKRRVASQPSRLAAEPPRSRAGHSVARTLPRARALTRHPAASKAKTSIFNCYMGESDVSFSFYHIVMCIIITLGQEFNVLLMVCMEKINHLATNCQ